MYFEEDKAQDNRLVLGGLHRPAQLVRGGLEVRLETEGRTGVWLLLFPNYDALDINSSHHNTPA